MFFRAMGRLTVRFLAGFGRAIGGIFKASVRHPVGTIFTVLIVGGLVYAWIAMDGFGIKLGGTSDSSVVTQEASTEASGKSADFLNAFGKLDANGMWNLMSNDLRQAQQASGVANADAMQKAINAKIAELVKDNSKPKYQFEWNNGRTKSDGTATDIFVGTTSWPAAGDKLPKTVIYIITTDKNGKIQEAASQMVKTPDPGDPIMTAAFPSKKAQSAAEAGSGTATSAQNPSTKELMAGLTNFDAKRVWNTFSSSYQKELTDKKITPESMQATFDSFKKDAQTKQYKLSYVGYSYQVTTNYTNDFTTDIYVSALQVDDSVMQFGYIILLDKTGKVIGIGSEGSPDPILSKALGRSQGQ